MNTPDVIGQPHGMGLRSDAGKIEINKVFAGSELPPGAVPVEERVLARYVPPGTKIIPHGVPPIGTIYLPMGSIDVEGMEDETELVVLPFRFPFYSRAYALRCAGHPCAVLRNVQPTELAQGNWVVVQYNEIGDWNATFGRIEKLNLMSFDLRMPDGALRNVSHEKIQFVGKVMCWWGETKRD